MANEYLSTSREAQKIAFDIQRSVKLETGSRLFILKRDVFSKRFVVVAEIVSGWIAKSTDYRNEKEFEIAITNTSFNDLISQGSYLGYGVPDTDNQIDIYQISTEQRDETKEDGFRPTWKNFAVRDGKERFTLP